MAETRFVSSLAEEGAESQKEIVIVRKQERSVGLIVACPLLLISSAIVISIRAIRDRVAIHYFHGLVLSPPVTLFTHAKETFDFDISIADTASTEIIQEI